MRASAGEREAPERRDAAGGRETQLEGEHVDEQLRVPFAYGGWFAFATEDQTQSFRCTLAILQLHVFKEATKRLERATLIKRG